MSRILSLRLIHAMHALTSIKSQSKNRSLEETLKHCDNRSDIFSENAQSSVRMLTNEVQ